jgi:hypothetical protein
LRVMVGVCYNVCMATNPLPENYVVDELAEEFQRQLDEDPELLAYLIEVQRQLDAGEIVPVDNHNEARRIVGLDPLPE